jgi:hypothetical protein
MSDKGREGFGKMSVEYVNESKRMADVILEKVHRGPGDTVDAAMHRAERLYGVSASWLHRLRYRHRDLTDMPVSAFFSIFNAYRAVCDAGERAYAAERELANARNSKLVGIADFVAGKTSTSAAKEEAGE